MKDQMNIKMQFFKIDPNNLGRGPGNYYLRANGFYSKIRESKVNIPFDKMNREHTINFLKSGGTFKGLKDDEFKKLKSNLGLN